MYPKIIINTSSILDNARAIKKLAESRGVTVTPVVKALAGEPQLIHALAELGFPRLGDATLAHFRNYQDVSAEKWLLRDPMLSEVAELVRLTDGALVSEAAVLRRLEEECARAERTYQVVLMAELGDLREGCETAELLELAALTEDLPHLRLTGIGANLSCYGNILPDENNMADLAAKAAAVEEKIGRPLERVSGGNSTSYPLLREGKLPACVNDLRCGESILLGNLPCYDVPIEGLWQNTFLVQAEIVELKEKPSLPWGKNGEVDSFGGRTAFADRGRRLRALAALGKQEIYINGLVPTDEKVELLGGCSDLLICDLTDSERHYQVGDVLTFACDYAALATGMSSTYLSKEYK